MFNAIDNGDHRFLKQLDWEEHKIILQSFETLWSSRIDNGSHHRRTAAIRSSPQQLKVNHQKGFVETALALILHPFTSNKYLDNSAVFRLVVVVCTVVL